eukprot:7325748-Alexandrium_andersonii.AAC.1
MVGPRRKWRYRAQVLVHALLLCDNFRDPARLRKTICSAATLCFPALGEAAESAMKPRAVLPSKVTIS